MNIDQAANARYGKIVLVSYAALNGLLLIVVCAGSWFLAARANSHGIAPNTSLGFRSQHTLASLHGWYVAQRAGFHFAAVADTIVTVAVFAIVAVAFIRRLNPMWILIVPIIGGIAVGVCFMIAGHQADKAAISVETTAAPQAESTGGADVDAATCPGVRAERGASFVPPGEPFAALPPTAGWVLTQRGGY